MEGVQAEHPLVRWEEGKQLTWFSHGGRQSTHCVLWGSGVGPVRNRGEWVKEIVLSLHGSAEGGDLPFVAAAAEWRSRLCHTTLPTGTKGRRLCHTFITVGGRCS